MECDAAPVIRITAASVLNHIPYSVVANVYGPVVGSCVGVDLKKTSWKAR